MRFSLEIQRILLYAGNAARQMGHSYVGSGHILLGIVASPCAAGRLLRIAGADTEVLRSMLTVLYGVGSVDMPLHQGFSNMARKILRIAGAEAKAQQQGSVQSLHLLTSVLRTENTAAIKMLMLSGLDTQSLFTQTVDALRWDAEREEIL